MAEINNGLWYVVAKEHDFSALVLLHMALKVSVSPPHLSVNKSHIKLHNGY